MTDSVFLREIREALRSLPKVLVWMVAEYVNDYTEEQKRKSVRGIDLFARHVRRHPTIRLGVCHGDQGIRITARAVWWPETAKLPGFQGLSCATPNGTYDHKEKYYRIGECEQHKSIQGRLL